jgi:NADPH-dependent curcumin reductase CurA
MNTSGNKQILLARRPVGPPVAEDFQFSDAAMPVPAAGELLVRMLYLSMDPYLRGRIGARRLGGNDPVPLGAVVEGRGIAQVTGSTDPRFATGDIIYGELGWQTHAIIPADRALKLDASLAPLTAWVALLGHPGLTAKVGIARILRVQPGENVVVSAAVGAVGQVAGPLAKLAGAARVVGVAGGPEKCRFAVDKLGYDACIDRHAEPDLKAAMARECPAGIDAYFDNTGGAVQDAVWPLLNRHGRIALCGQVSEYNSTGEERPGPNLGSGVTRRLRIEGFGVGDHLDLMPAWRTEAAELLRAGKMVRQETIIGGFENTPAAFASMLAGKSFGKTIVRGASAR